LTPAPYLDTSALAKWYLNEARSEEFERYLQAQQSAAISRLTILEFRCLLARRRRTREIDARTENRVFAAFEQDLRAGFLFGPAAR
jgi:predicted nucleic acid-binding protein